VIAADYLKLPPGEKKYSEMLLFTDYMTQFTWAFPQKKADTSTSSADALISMCRTFAPLHMLLTDNGPNFKGHKMESACMMFGIDHQTTPAYSPHCNGLIERECGLTLQTLSKLCNPGPSLTGTATVSTKWPCLLPEAMNIINNCITTMLGMLPHKVMFSMMDDSFDLDNPMELGADSAILFSSLDAFRDGIVDNSVSTQAKHAAYFNKRAHPTSFNVGDHILVHNSQYFNKSNREAKLKLSTPWFGPLVIHKRHHNSYVLKTLAGSISMGRIHANRLNKFILNGD